MTGGVGSIAGRVKKERLTRIIMEKTAENPEDAYP